MPLLNIANVLTVVRLVLVPVFLLALFWAGGHDALWRVVATAVFVLAAITDRVDGDLARRRGLVTDFGKVVDPIADKALTGSALLGLSVLGELWWWATAVIIGREALVTVLRFWVIRHGVIPASRGGKLKTLLQTVAIVLYLVPVDALDPARWALLAAALLVTVGTGVDYAVQAVRLRAASRRGGEGR
ncbi:CDP-diacylglycerol--glycerol-3-phosphate 3-phosphatidyltransferase [Salinifilum aidingensis]